MLVKELFLGKVEGADEFEKQTAVDELYFMGIDEDQIEDIMDGEIRYIHGYKGTGKTSLIKRLEKECTNRNIKYISIGYRKLQEDAGFIEQFRGFLNDYHSTKELIEGFRTKIQSIKLMYRGMDDTDTATLAFWEWYLLSLVADKYLNDIDSNSLIYSSKNKLFRALAKLLNVLVISVDSNGNFSAGINMNAEGISEDTTENISYSAEKIRDLSSDIKNNLEEKVVLFIDELELTKGRGTYDIDRIIIMNLILATRKINKLSKNLHIVLAVRDEVLYDLQGVEINKLRDDYGLSINWWSNERNKLDHKLWRLMFKKITYSMKEKENTDLSYQELWNRWFPFSIEEKESWKFIFELTWARPRDFVRILTLMQKSCRNNHHFTRECYDKIAKKYSQTAYDEMKEEIATLFDEKTSRYVERVIQSLGSNFTLSQFMEKATDYEIEDPEKVLEEMYRVSFIGNHYCIKNDTKWRFAYRGDLLPEKTKPFEVHRALREALGIKDVFNADIFYVSNDGDGGDGDGDGDDIFTLRERLKIR